MPIAAFGRHRHGHAIYDIPEAPFHAGFAGPLDTEETDTIVARYFERTLSLVETEENSLEFLSDDETILVQLESEPDFEINDVILCQVTDTVAGIVDACYMLALTENMSTNYIALTPAFVLTAPVWSDTEINQITLWDNDLYETGVGTRIFTNITYTLAVLDGAPQTPDVDVWRISFTDGWYGENAVFVVEETGPTTLVFRNCDPPIPTDRPPSEPEDHVSWRINPSSRIRSEI